MQYYCMRISSIEILAILHALLISNTGDISFNLSRINVVMQVEKRCCACYHPHIQLVTQHISVLYVGDKPEICCKK
jgi:hypothetical protein